jgi:hypothetical protein
MSKIKEYEAQFLKSDLKIDLKAIDFIVVSEMDRYTGDYENLLITNRPRWKKDSVLISNDALIRIEVFVLGTLRSVHMFHSKDEFENTINF